MHIDYSESSARLEMKPYISHAKIIWTLHICYVAILFTSLSMSEPEKQLSKRKRKAQESWASKKSDKKSKVDLEIDEDAPINPTQGEAPKKKVKKATTESTETENNGSAEVAKPIASETNSKNKRFILFIGNLSFKTTKEDIEAHIKPTGVTPLAIRLQTDPVTKKPKGFAFMDLPNFQSLDKILNLHHSSLSGRKINVELTAGGGGSGEKRKAKIAKKNEKLDVERETAQKTRREADAKKVRSAKNLTGAEQEDQKKKKEIDMNDVNPARRKRIA